MSEKVKKMHTDNELLKESRQEGIGFALARKNFMDWSAKMEMNGKDPMAGSNVQFDRSILLHHFFQGDMEDMQKRFHYRNIDVSSTKESVKRWSPDINILDFKRNLHRVTPDLEDSIAEMRYYQNMIFSPAARGKM